MPGLSRSSDGQRLRAQLLPRFALDATLVGGASAVLAVSGELDLYEVPKLNAALETVARAKRIVVDLTGVTFVDSTALAALLRAHRRLASEDRELVLVAADPTIRKLFDVTGFDRLFRIFASVDEAAGEPVPAGTSPEAA
jgi:anti-anti-sigma factor